MLSNPDHKRIKVLAERMLNTPLDTPDGKVKICNELLPIAEFENGFVTPNTNPPNAVYVELDGELWRLMKGNKKRWKRV